MKATNILEKVFRTENVETWALNNVSLNAKKGKFVTLVPLTRHDAGYAGYANDASHLFDGEVANEVKM